jgi:hypothetical protein
MQVRRFLFPEEAQNVVSLCNVCDPKILLQKDIFSNCLAMNVHAY